MIYKLFSNCIIVKGANRSSICDLQKRKLFIISNSIYQILKKGFFDSIKEQENVEINSFVSFLLDNDLAFQIDSYDELKLFPKLDLAWDYPSIIQNAIFDFEIDSLVFFSNYFSVIDELHHLNCKILTVRVFEDIESVYYHDLLERIQTTTIMLDFYINLKYENFELLTFLSNHNSVNSIHIFSQTLTSNFKSHFKEIHFSESVLESELACGLIKDYYFSINIEHFTESQLHNTCLNRKISIDKKGRIKNCPSMQRSYGSITDVTISSVVNDEEFKSLWAISKDKITICNVCEFRYICSDCRAYLEDPEDIYSKPLKCGYNPFTNEWESWQEDERKFKSAIHYGFIN